VDQLFVTTTNSSVVFNSGVFSTKATVVSNGASFKIGNGTDAATMNLLGGVHTFVDGVVVSNNSTLSADHALVTYGGRVVNGGAWVTDPTTNIFNDNFITTESGYIAASAGDVYIFTNDDTTAGSFLNRSTNSGAFHTEDAKFIFDGTLAVTQNFYAAGHNRESILGSSNSTSLVTGSWYSATLNNFSLETLEISNFSTVRVWDAFSGLGGDFGANDGQRAALYVDNLILGADSFLIISSNVEVYFLTSNSWGAANFALLGGGHGTGGELHQLGLDAAAAVPEPSVMLLWLGGAATLYQARRRHRRQTRAEIAQQRLAPRNRVAPALPVVVQQSTRTRVEHHSRRRQSGTWSMLRAIGQKYFWFNPESFERDSSLESHKRRRSRSRKNKSET
jgi:hypothetical protein